MQDRTDPAARRPRLSRRDDLLTVLFGAWLVAGVFLDRWAHNNDKPESFFTVWHGVFYSGFVACATWMTWQVVRQRRGRALGLEAVPVGYGLGVAGVAVFLLGGVADMVWHQIFGIEVDFEALVSPLHLALFVGATLVLTSPSGPPGPTPRPCRRRSASSRPPSGPPP